jgi:hypothetical protein
VAVGGDFPAAEWQRKRLDEAGVRIVITTLGADLKRVGSRYV